MTIDDQIKDEKIKINREARKISALSSDKIGKYEYFTSWETLPPNQKQIVEQAKFTYFSLGKAFEKQTKTKHMILDHLKQYAFLVMILKINLLIWIWQMMKKTIWQSILKNLKIRQDNKILT